MAIENKNRNAQEDASIEVAEASRETTWKSKSYMGSFFVGDFDISMAFPFPEQPKEDQQIGDDICNKVDAWKTSSSENGPSKFSITVNASKITM